MASEHPIDKKPLELDWANSAVSQHLLPHLQILWNNLRSTFKTSASWRRQFILWQLTEDGPATLYTMQAVDFVASFQGGLQLTFATPHGPFHVSHIPAKLPGVDIFVWIPQFAEVRWAPYDYMDLSAGRHAVVPICFKLASNLPKSPTVGDEYVSTAAQLRQHFPQHKQ